GHQRPASLAGACQREAGMNARKTPAHLTETRWLRLSLTILALAFTVLVLELPLVFVFIEAFAQGWGVYVASILDPDARAAIKLTLLVAVLALPVNLVFGVAAAWAITRFEFRGKQLLITLIDLPFSVSPVVAGLV